MHEIVTGKINAEKARELYSEVTGAYVLNQPAAYAEKFQFDVPSGDTADADKTPKPGPKMKEATDKVKEIISSEKS
jgi:hypothetical protein